MGKTLFNSSYFLFACGEYLASFPREWVADIFLCVFLSVLSFLLSSIKATVPKYWVVICFFFFHNHLIVPSLSFYSFISVAVLVKMHHTPTTLLKNCSIVIRCFFKLIILTVLYHFTVHKHQCFQLAKLYAIICVQH